MLEDLKKQLGQEPVKYELFVFDLFDTLITRTVHPEYVKMLAAKRLALYLGFALRPEEIYSLRKRLEAEICGKNKANGYDFEFHFDELCERIFQAINDRIALKDNFETFYNLIRAAEIECEKLVQKIDPEVLGIIQLAGTKKHLTGCVSDFYLGREIVSELLHFHGNPDLFDYYYISGDRLVGKRSGRLYDILITETQKSPSSILMTGDNRVSDYRMPLSKGIESFFIDRENRKREYKSLLKKALRKKNLVKEIEIILKKRDLKAGEKPLFQEMVFPFLLFIQRLHSRLIKKGIKDIFFISKEGKFLKELFDIYQGCFVFHISLRVKSHYLIASRRSTFVPSLGPLSTEKFELLFRESRDISPSDFFTNLNFSGKEVDELAIPADCLHTPIINFDESRFLNDLKQNAKFGNFYERKRLEQKANLVKYLGSFGVDYESKCFCLVDVGWKGTIQDNLFRALGSGRQVEGFYLGMMGNVIREPGNCKEGLLFDTSASSKVDLIFGETSTLYEVILGAPHGSAKEYLENGVITDDNESESELFRKSIEPIQVGIKESFEALCELFTKTHFNFEDFSKYFKKRFAQMVLTPGEDDLRVFESFYHYENFGSMRKVEFRGEKIRFKEKMENLGRLIISPRKTLRGYWIPITLKNLGLGCLSPACARLRYLQLLLRGSL